MTQISKLTKEDLAQTGFKSRTVAAKYVKEVLKKNAKDFKSIDDLKNTLRTQFNNMKNFGVDLNEVHKTTRIVNKSNKTATKAKTAYKEIVQARPDLKEIHVKIKSDEILKTLQYKLPSNKEFNGKKIKAVYFYNFEGVEEVINNVRQLYNQQATAFKFNLSFGYILKHIDTKQYKYFSPQWNNRFFDFPETISNTKSLTEVLNKIDMDMYKFKESLKRPSTEWKFYKFLDYEITTYKLDTTIGHAVSLPTHFYEGCNINNVVKFENLQDNLCFWRCLAAYLNPEKSDYRRLETPAKDLYNKFYGKKYEPSYEGVQFLEYRKFLNVDLIEEYEKAEDEIDKIEAYFKININIYTQDEKEMINNELKPVTKIDRRSINTYNDTLYLLRYDKHFCYIKKFEKFVFSFKCCKCGKLWSNFSACQRHEKACSDFCKHDFVGGYCQKTKSVFEDLPKKYRSNTFFDHFITYDFEAILSKIDDKKTDSLTYTNKHIPVSFSIFSNIEGYDKEPIFECCNDPKELIYSFVKTLVVISDKAYKINSVKYNNVLEYLNTQIDIAKNEKELAYANSKKDRFLKWLREVPVIGFNSGKYDSNLMKKWMSGALSEFDKPENEEVSPLKSNNMYRVIKSKSLKFLDMANYLAAGSSLDQWLKAYQCSMTKGFFPYEWLDDFTKLDSNSLPAYNDWFSSLKNKNIDEEDYKYCLQVWNDNKMKTMKDFLKWYNNGDVIPMVEAINKMFEFYRAKGLDMFKDAISLPGLAYKMLLSCTKAKFSLFEEEHKELYYLMKRNIVGGPSIIFHRYHEVDKTKIRGGKLCKSVVGYDANALYLWAIAQAMPTGDYKHITTYDLQTLKHDIMTNKLFGFVECDIEVPDNLKDHFSEMCPIFKNVEINQNNKEVIGEHMYDYAKANNIPLHKTRKLIGSMFGKKILLYTPLLKWYYDHGLEVTKFYQAIQYDSRECFKGIAEDIANARRAGDVDESKAIIAETMKLVGNSLYGRCVMDKEKHVSTSFCNLQKVSKKINDPHFKDLEELDNDRFEVTAGKHKIIMDTPIQIGCAVYQLAKLRMLEFYYDCLDKYIDRSDFQYVEMDTDSAYLGLSAKSLNEVIKPEMREEYEKDKYNWFPNETTKELKAFNKRTPGLFKVEFEGKSIYALCSKLYFVEGDTKNKFSCKGIQKSQNDINKDRFHNVLFNGVKDTCTNKGFRVIDNSMITYIQQKKGLSYVYDKRRVLEDGVTTVPLDI